MSTPDPASPTITLETPLKRGEQTIDAITLRKPRAGELRGLSLFELVKMDATAIMTLLPRITAPAITRAEAERLDPPDLFELGTEIANFLSPRAMREPDTASPTT